MNQTIELARKIRVDALRMIYGARGSHIGSCLSSADILAALYTKALRFNAKDPKWPGRDRLLVSKGHAAAIVYAVLAETGFFPKEWLNHYAQKDSPLLGHLTSHQVPGVEISTGSLGHGLAIGTGMALAAKKDDQPYRVFVLMSDGELDEGSNWEASLFAAHHKLDNLTVIIDYNKIQSFGNTNDVLNLEPLAEKWRAFGWSTQEINGHDLSQIEAALANFSASNKPKVVIAHTIKGKGVSFMENQLVWHYKSPSENELADALKELGENS